MYQYHTLANGLRIVFRRNHSAVTHSAVYINVGSRDEVGAEEGVAHFIEHSIFKGTEHRRAYHILNRIDGVGGELNAFTTKEETCIYASSLTQHLERCLELFSDVLFHSTFPAKEIEKEKDVVIEEINGYRDAPADLIYDEFEEMLFKGHPLSHNILGTKRNVKRFSSEFVSEFMHRNYTTDKMVISVVGNVDFEKVVRLCEKYFGHYPKGDSSHHRTPVSDICTFTTTINRHTHQLHALIGCLAPSAYEEKKVAFTLMNNILGGPAMNSRLNVAVREKYGFCYTIESQYVPMSDTGIFYIYAGLDHDSHDRAIDLIMNELNKMASAPMSDACLHAAQQQMIGQMAIANDVALNEMQSIGKACMLFGRVDSLEEMNQDILSVTADDIQSLAKEYFAPGRFSQLCYR